MIDKKWKKQIRKKGMIICWSLTVLERGFKVFSKVFALHFCVNFISKRRQKDFWNVLIEIFHRIESNRMIVTTRKVTQVSRCISTRRWNDYYYSNGCASILKRSFRFTVLAAARSLPSIKRVHWSQYVRRTLDNFDKDPIDLFSLRLMFFD